jgi:Zn-dependent protease with chaperone function
MTTTRRTILAGLAATVAGPALAQFDNAIRPQSDPWAQVDPYADPRNGFSPGTKAAPAKGSAPPPSRGNAIFQGGVAPPLPTSYPLEPLQIRLGQNERGAALSKEGGLYPSAKLQQALQEFCQPFLRAAVRQNLPWEVFLPAASNVNAYAYPGGKLFFFDGIITLCDDPSEFGAIVAHEIGHIDYDHHARRIQTDTLLEQAMKGNVNPDEMKKLEVALGGAAETALMSGWGRENEFEADAHSLTLLAKIGMDPARASVPFRRLLKVEPPDRQTSLFSSHPGTVERIARLEEAAPSYPRPRQAFSPPGWNVLKAAFPTPPSMKAI